MSHPNERKCDQLPGIHIEPPAKVLAVIRRGEVFDAQIDADHLAGFPGLWRAVHQDDVQEKHTVPSFDERCTPRTATFETPFLVVPKHGRKALSGMKERQAEGPIPLPEAENALIVVNRRRRKRGVGFALDLQGSADAGNRSNGQVGRQPKAAPDLSVADMLDLHLVTRMDLACHVGNEIAGVGKGHKCRVEFAALFWSGRKFAGNCAYGVHKGRYITRDHHIQRRLKPWKAFPPLPLKGCGIHGLKPRFW